MANNVELCSDKVSMETLLVELEYLQSWYVKLSQIIDSHLNDFFSYDLWERTLEQRDLLTLLLSNESKSDLKGNRGITKLPSCCFSCEQGLSCCRYCLKDKGRNAEPPAQTHTPVKKTVNKFLTEKKEHEITILSNIIKKMSTNINCKKVVDLGSGKGYLCQHTTNVHELEVLGLEMSDQCSTSAVKRLERMIRADSKANQEKYKTATYTIDQTTIEGSKKFVDFVHQQFSSSKSKESKYILTGLHACGDLTASAVQLFVKEDAFRGLCVIGCCYNLIQEGFPLSETLKGKGLRLGKQAKFLACQCPVRWKETSQDLNKSLLYRAILEKIFSDKGIGRKEIEHIKFRRIKKKADTFTEYMKYVRFQHPKLEGVLSDIEENEYYERYSEQWPLMQEFHRARMQLAPLIEKLILLDRMCYMREQGLQNASVVRLFDSVISPRCYALVCTKYE